MARKKKTAKTEEAKEEEKNPLLSDLEDEGKVNLQAAEDRKNYIQSIQQNNWGYSPKGLESKRAAMAQLATKTGMYARIPLICKSDACPYAGSCSLLPYNLAPEGEYCPVETAQIEARAASYAQDFDLDSLSFTDRALLNEIIGLDIMLERCRALMAKEGTPVIEITAGISENGEEIRQPTVSKAWEAYERISKKRDNAYQLMMMTRKDNKNKEEDNSESALSDILANTIISEDGNDTDDEEDKK